MHKGRKTGKELIKCRTRSSDDWFVLAGLSDVQEKAEADSQDSQMLFWML